MATLSFETAIQSPGISDYIESSNIGLTIRSNKYIKITNSTNRESKNCIQMHKYHQESETRKFRAIITQLTSTHILTKIKIKKSVDREQQSYEPLLWK